MRLRRYRCALVLSLSLVGAIALAPQHGLAPDGTVKEITHAALQEPDGSWASKLGNLPLIRHANPYAVDGPTYGVPVATYVRRAGNVRNARNPGPLLAPADDAGNPGQAPM